MMAYLRVPWAFIVRDFRMDISYKLGFLFRVSSGVLMVAIYYFISNVFGDTAAPYLKAYGGSYFAFVVIGVAFSEYMSIGINAIGDSVREGQMAGTLELMLLSPTRLAVTLVSSSLWSYVFASLRISVYLIVGAALGLGLGNANVPFALLSLALAIASFSALGLLTASVILLMKRGDLLGWALRVGSLLLAGVYYPIEVLPGWLRVASQALPLTHALELLRRSILLGDGFGQLWGELLALIGLTLVLFPLGLLACHTAIHIAQTDGSLSHY
jgi:ABC-2 type transport system permease protein